MTADVLVLRRIVIFRPLLVGLLSVLLSSVPMPRAACAAGESPPVARPIKEVTMKNGVLSARTRDASLRAVLRDMSILTSVPIDMDPAIDATVTTTFIDFPLDKAVERLLFAAGEKNLAMEFSRKPGAKEGELAIEKIKVVRGAAKRQRSLTEIAAEIAEREKEYRDYFAEMDRDGNKIARALSKRLDPNTSPDESIKLKTYLRQTSVDDPEDKKLLKAALMDSRFQGGVVSDIQMALLHAMQDHPEESDKDYIVALLDRRDNRVGWLYYAMLKVWDERYVPYLIENVAKEQSLSSIEILGRMHVERAVPFLEVALQSKKPETRIKAQDALFSITGKKYPIVY